MIQLVCDRCGASMDSSGKIGYIDWNFRESLGGGLGKNYFEERHFCSRCMGEIFEAIAGEEAPAPDPGKEGPEAGQEAALEQEESRQQAKKKKGRPAKYSLQEQNHETRGRKGCDIGKILALRDAGWPLAKIAEEMSMEEASVRTAIWRHKKRMEAGGKA